MPEMLEVVSLLALAVVVGWAWTRSRPLPAPFPPGPPADPFIGHTRIFPQKNTDTVFMEWGKKYGDVIHLKVLGKHIVVLNSYKAASEILDNRGAKYSSRPRFPLHEMVGWGDMLPLASTGEHVLRQRKLFQHALSRQASLVFRPVQREMLCILLKNLLEKPKESFKHVNHFVVANIMEIAYAHTVVSEKDVYVQMIDKVNNIVASLGSNQILLVVPALKYLPSWLPGAGFIRTAKTAAVLSQKLRHNPFEEVRQRMTAGTARPCFVSIQLEDREADGGLTEQDIKDLETAGMTMYITGTETTFAAITSFFAAMILHPEVQSKARAEIESVIGPDRFPDFSDRPLLPYVESVMHEVMRWSPTVPLGVPREAIADDIYEGMYIPKGATVIVNTTALSLDQNVYADPHVFRPERFLPPNPEPLPTDFFFGFGRRICPGRHLADASLWLVLASILTAFEIVPLKDEDGKYVVPEITFTSSATNHPEPFPCEFRPRTQKFSEMIQQL